MDPRRAIALLPVVSLGGEEADAGFITSEVSDGANDALPQISELHCGIADAWAIAKGLLMSEQHCDRTRRWVSEAAPAMALDRVHRPVGVFCQSDATVLGSGRALGLTTAPHGAGLID